VLLLRTPVSPPGTIPFVTGVALVAVPGELDVLGELVVLGELDVGVPVIVTVPPPPAGVLSWVVP
jgi:hypothetical protein